MAGLLGAAAYGIPDCSGVYQVEEFLLPNIGIRVQEQSLWSLSLQRLELAEGFRRVKDGCEGRGDVGVRFDKLNELRRLGRGAFRVDPGAEFAHALIE